MGTSPVKTDRQKESPATRRKLCWYGHVPRPNSLPETVVQGVLHDMIRREGGGGIENGQRILLYICFRTDRSLPPLLQAATDTDCQLQPCFKQLKTDHRFPYLPQATEDRPQISICLKQPKTNQRFPYLPQATEDRPQISVSASSNRRQTTDFHICLKQPKTDHSFPHLPQATEDKPQISISASTSCLTRTSFEKIKIQSSRCLRIRRVWGGLFC